MAVDVWLLALLTTAAFATAVLSAVAGFGGGVLLLPVVVAVFGTRDAAAVLTVAQLARNGSRVWFNRREVNRHLVGIFAAGAVPAATVGALVLTTAPLAALTRVIGMFLLAMVIWRRLRPHTPPVGDGAAVTHVDPGCRRCACIRVHAERLPRRLRARHDHDGTRARKVTT